MESQNQIHTLGQPENFMLGPIPCNGAVCISRSRYDELVHAEMEREILFHAYQQMGAFSMEPVMDAIFNPVFKFKAKESTAGAE